MQELQINSNRKTIYKSTGKKKFMYEIKKRKKKQDMINLTFN